LDVLKITEKEVKYKYDCIIIIHKDSSYLVGFKNIVDDYFKQQDEEFSNHKLKPLNKRFSSELILTNLSNERKHDINSLDNVYNLLGHEVYSNNLLI